MFIFSPSKNHFKITFFFSAVTLTLFSLFGCATSKNIDTQSKIEVTEKSGEELTLVFAGDIMAHTPNYTPGKFDRIWRDISPLVKTGDLSFANIEAPVADGLPWSTYPQFNMHSEYVEEAIKAGFNVFSLTNNHTNDQYLEGIKQTKSYFDSHKGIWSSGLKDKSGDPLTYKIIEKKGWKILFVAVTEILNRGDFSSYIDYYPSTEKRRKQLLDELKVLQSEENCDLFVLSIHTDEPEYILEVTENHKKFYRQLIEECKVDIIWANHPHVAKVWEETSPSSAYAGQKNRKAFIMYANGNTISAQRTSPSFTAPDTNRDYTGEGIIMRLKLQKSSKGGFTIKSYEPFLITTYITPGYQYVIKLLDNDFISALDRAEVPNWSQYLGERKKIMERVLGK